MANENNISLAVTKNTVISNTEITDMSDVQKGYELLRTKAREITDDRELDLAATRARLETRYSVELFKRDSVATKVMERYTKVVDSIEITEGVINRLNQELDKQNEVIFTSNDIEQIEATKIKIDFIVKQLVSFKKDLQSSLSEFYKILETTNIKESFSDPNGGSIKIGIMGNSSSIPQSNIPIQDIVEVISNESQEVEFSSKPKIDNFFDNI